MERTFVEKILNAPVGSIVVREPDYVLSHDNSARIRRIFERMGGENVYCPNQLVIVLDGKVSGLTNEMINEYNSIRNFVEEQHIERFYDCDRGICHQVLADIVKPGMLITGSDSHMATAGAFNCFAMGVNKTETAALWKTGKIWFRVPETIKIVLKNSLSDGFVAKDLALWIMGILSEIEVNGQIVEYHGDGVGSLSIADRMTIANVSTEMGIECSVFPPDDVLADYFGEPAVRGIWADKGANYVRYIEIDLAKVFPLVLDTVKGEIRGVNEIEGIKIQQGLIGGCAAGRLEDLRLAAMILDGKHVADHFQLFIVTASRAIYLQAIEEGVIDILSRAGAVILGASCGPCLSVGHMASADNSRLISTTNSYFIGNTATSGVKKYVASPVTVAMTAMRGELSTVIHFQGAEFKCRPKPEEQRCIEGYDYRRRAAVWNYSDIDNISCRQIFSEKLTYKITHEQTDLIKPALFAGLDMNFSVEVKPGDLIVAGENFGCGGLIKHAVTGLMAVGIRLIIVKSVNRNFYRMAMNHGLYIIINREVAKDYTSGDQLTLDMEAGKVYLNNREYILPEVDPLFFGFLGKKIS